MKRWLIRITIYIGVVASGCTRGYAPAYTWPPSDVYTSDAYEAVLRREGGRIEVAVVGAEVGRGGLYVDLLVVGDARTVEPFDIPEVWSLARGLGLSISTREDPGEFLTVTTSDGVSVVLLPMRYPVTWRIGAHFADPPTIMIEESSEAMAVVQRLMFRTPTQLDPQQLVIQFVWGGTEELVIDRSPVSVTAEAVDSGAER